MKESRLGPRQWAFVVLAGGAACALPFIRKQPDAAQGASDALAQPTPRPASPEIPRLSGPVVASDNTSVPSRISAAGETLTPPATVETLPDWANAQRSPFDELLGSKAVVKPPAFAAKESIPIQPLKPWVQPGAVDVSNPSTASEIPTTTADHGDGLLANSSHPPDAFEPIVAARKPSVADSPQATAAWPDQRVSLEQIAQLNYSASNSDLVSAIVSPPPTTANSNTTLAANVVTRPPNASQTAIAAPGMSQGGSLQEALPIIDLPNAPRLISGPSSAAPAVTPRSQATVHFGAPGNPTITPWPANPAPAPSAANSSAPAGSPSQPAARSQSLIFQPSSRP